MPGFQQALAKLQTVCSAAAIESARAGLKCLHNELTFVRAGVSCTLAQVCIPIRSLDVRDTN